MTSHSHAIVLFSGGQDSTTCLAWALDRFERVETIGFDYGQRHRIELDCRGEIRERLNASFPKWRARMGADHLLNLGVLGEISSTALTSDAAIAIESTGLPNTFVPGRNLLFLTLAAAVAYRRGLPVLVGGMCETDFSGYPDCRDNTIKSLQVSLSLGMDKPIRIETPLMWIDKAATWKLAYDLGAEALVELVKDATHTCYRGERGHTFPWGRGCAACPACDLRATGYQRWIETRI
jgi:7-cyano-7-deazaguanine synthase